jgi:hypothetical protein
VDPHNLQRHFARFLVRFWLPHIEIRDVWGCSNQVDSDCVKLPITYVRPLEWRRQFVVNLFEWNKPREFLRDLAERLFLQVSSTGDPKNLSSKKEILDVWDTPEFARFDAVMKRVVRILQSEEFNENEAGLMNQLQEATEFVDQAFLRAQVITEITRVVEVVDGLTRCRGGVYSMLINENNHLTRTLRLVKQFRQHTDRLRTNKQALQVLLQTVQTLRRNLAALLYDFTPINQYNTFCRWIAIDLVNENQHLFMWVVRVVKILTSLFH